LCQDVVSLTKKSLFIRRRIATLNTFNGRVGVCQRMQLVVITGASRSGSTFFGDLMSHAENTRAHHEMVGGRDLMCVSAYCPNHPFVRHAVREGLERLAPKGEHGNTVAVDVNAYLAFATDAIKAAQPDARLFHLVRDGRKVIASNWVRKMYTGYAKGIDIRPFNDAELDAWDAMSRFDKLCWQWNRIVTELMGKDLPLIRLEEAIKDYDYLDEKLLQPGGIDLPKDVWEARRAHRVNASRFKLRDLLRGRPTDLDWSADHERSFQKFCGQSLGELGYS
jgi:hypothetical protein